MSNARALGEVLTAQLRAGLIPEQRANSARNPEPHCSCQVSVRGKKPEGCPEESGIIWGDSE